MFIESPRFPENLALGGQGGPGFFTQVVTSPSGAEQRTTPWTYARAEYDVGLLNKTAAETQALLSFFFAVAKGRLHGFRFKDLPSNDYTFTDAPLGIGTGAPQTLQLVKRYTSGAYIYDRPLYKPVVGTVIIKVIGVVTVPTGIDHTTGLVTITAAGGAMITASGEFDVPVRFNIDALKISRDDGPAFSWPSIPLFETRDIA